MNENFCSVLHEKLRPDKMKIHAGFQDLFKFLSHVAVAQRDNTLSMIKTHPFLDLKLTVSSSQNPAQKKFVAKDDFMQNIIVNS